MTEILGMTYMTEAEQKILSKIHDNPWIVAHMKNPSEEFLLSAVFENPHILRFVHNQSYELRLLAVKLDYTALNEVNGKTPEILRAAAKHNNRGVMGADLTRKEIELYANSQNVKKFGLRAQTPRNR